MISVIIVNYNSSELVINCIKSVKKVLDPVYEIIVVDNCSLDEDAGIIENAFEDVKLIRNSANEGFGRANNLGVMQSEGEFILFLNPDTILTDNFILPIIRYMKENEKAGVCGPGLIYENGTYQNSTGMKLGYIYETAEALMLIKLLRLFYNRMLFSRVSSGSPVEVSWLSAACFIVRRNVFEEAGGFNEEFFLNYEDIDFCERIRNMGYKNYYFPELSCIHLDQQSQSRNFERFVYNRYAARRVYARNNYNPVKKIIINFIHLTGIILRIITTRFLHSGKEKNERLRGYKQALKLYLK